MDFPKRDMMSQMNPMEGYDSQSMELAMRENELGAGGEQLLPDNPLHAVDVPLPTPEDSPAFYAAGVPPAHFDLDGLTQGDLADPRITGELLTQEMQEEAANSEALQQGNMEAAEEDGLQNKRLFGV